MHAYGPRINVLFTHLMTMLFVLVAIGSSVSYMQLSSSGPKVDLRVSELSFLRILVRERCDQAYVRFDLTAGMYSLNSSQCLNALIAFTN